MTADYTEQEVSAALAALRALILMALERGSSITNAEFDQLGEEHRMVAHARLTLDVDALGWS